MTVADSPPDRRLARLVASSGLTNLGDGIALVAWAWIASLLTRDALLIALMPVALRLPWFLLALPAGIVTDRVDRRRLILAMDGLRAAAFLGAAGALWLALPLPEAPATGLSAPSLFAALILCAALVGTAEVFRDNAAQTFLPSIVPKEALERANGRLWAVELTGNALLGPALGAMLIAAAVWSPMAVNAALFALAAALVAGLPGAYRPPARPRDWRAELGEGLRFLRASPLLTVLALVTGAWNLVFEMMNIALVLHVQENFGLGPRAYGLILASGAVGSIAGSLAGERVVWALGPGRTAQWMLAASAVGFIVIALAPGGVALATALAAFTGTGMVWNIVTVTYRQRTVPDALLGRVNSVYRLLAWGMMPLGLLLSGASVRVAEGLGLARGAALTVPLWLAAAGALVLTLAAWAPLARGFRAATR